MTHAEDALAVYQAEIGKTQGTGEWFTVDQARINAFADVTEDHQFIHVDPEQSAQLSPFGTTIAHGFLTLSLLTPLTSSVRAPEAALKGIAMGLNYGFDKVRFINPVKVDSRIRATAVIAGAELKGNAVQITTTVTVEIEGEDKPAIVADWVTRAIYS